MAVRYEQTLSPQSSDIEAIRMALGEFNRGKAGEFARQKMAAFARADRGALIGGATGEVHWGWLYVDLLWVHEAHRGRGIGAHLLQALEHLADGCDVTGYHLGTTSFQALDFYRRCGYQVWGELPDFPPGHTNYSLYKRRG